MVMTSVTPASALSLSTLAAGAAAFFSMGMIQAMYGPLFPLFQSKFGVSLSEVGLLASVHFLGAAFGPPMTGVLLNRFSVRQVVVGSLLILMLGVTGVALAPSWWLAVTCALVGGIGLGGISGALNAAYAGLGTRPVNLVNAVFGLGSMAAPLIVAAFAARSLSLPFMFVVAGGLLTLLAARIWGFPDIPVRASSSGGRPGPKVAIFSVMIVLYVGLEVGFGAWSGRHLTQIGVAQVAAVVSGYWGGLTLGRVLAGIFGGRFKPERLVLGSLGLSTLCAVVASLGQPALTPAAYVLAGVTLGPVFGTMLTWMSGHISGRVLPYLLTSGSLGGMLAPVLLGWLTAQLGEIAIPVTLAVFGALTSGLMVLASRMLRGTALSAH